MIMKKALTWAGAIAVGVTTLSAAHANDLVVEPFAQSALTQEQKQAWQYYIAQESAQYGCQYGDDIRLQEDPRGTLQALANGDDMDPLQVTLRTFLFAGENVQTLLARNMVIASMECNPVYYFDGELIGHPVLPFEEHLDILLSKLRQTPELSAHMEFLRGTKAAAIDARWFWAFYLLDGDHYRLLGQNVDTIQQVARMFVGSLGNVMEENAFWLIYDNVFSQGIYVENTNECQGEQAEPNANIVVDKNIAWEMVEAFYREEGISSRGSWRPVVQQEGDGYQLAESTAIEDPINPYFNVSRRVTIQPQECQ